MNIEDMMLKEISQSQKTNPISFHLHDVSKIVKCIEAGSTAVVARGWGWRRGVV